MLQSNNHQAGVPSPNVMQGQVIGAVPVSYVYNQPHNWSIYKEKWDS